MSAAGVWKEAMAADGRTYYYNTSTNATTWEKPADMDAAPRPTPASAWKTHMSPDGRPYYEDTINKKTTWDIPEVLKSSQPQATPARSSAPSFVAASQSSNVKPEPNEYPRPDRTFTSDRGAPNFGAAVVKEEQYGSLQEAETVFFKLLKKIGVESDWSWEKAVKEAIKSPEYRAITDAKDRRAAFDKFIDEARKEEKEMEKERKEKLKEEFASMLEGHPEIKFYTRWSTARPTIEEEVVFKRAKHEDERVQLFNEYRKARYQEHLEKEKAQQQRAVSKLTDLLPTLRITPLTRWSEAQTLITESEDFASDKDLQHLPKIEMLKAFEQHQKDAENVLYNQRSYEHSLKARKERQNRDGFTKLLTELRKDGKIRANSRWTDCLPLFEEDPRYEAMLGQAGSSAMELFWDVVEEEDKDLRHKRNIVYDVLEAERYEMTTGTTFEDFKAVMKADGRTKSYSDVHLQPIYDRLMHKVAERLEKERHRLERAKRHEIDDLRSRIKKLTKPEVKLDDTWESVRPRVEETKEYLALETDDLRKAAFEKHIRRLKEKEEDDRRHKHRDGDRERDAGRNGHAKRGRSAEPEEDAYEADRRKAQAARERTYGKRAIPGVSPAPRERERTRDWDRDREGDRYEPRGDSRDGGRLAGGNHYDRDRRAREVERERTYLDRADPKERTTVLEYGDEGADDAPRSATSRRRERRDSDAGSERSSKRLKRYDRETASPHSTRGGGVPANGKTAKLEDKTKAKKEVPLVVEEGFHSGSEEGEIEED